MIARILATALTEARIARRNRWVAIAIALMVVFSLVLSAAGSAPTGALGADRLSVVVASLTSLSVYLVPLLALLMSFDAVAGEVERGTLPLLLTYPVSRREILLGKLVAHLAVLILALVIGYGTAAAVAFATDPAAIRGASRALAADLDLRTARRDVPRDRLRPLRSGPATLGRGRSRDRRLAGAGRALRSRPAGGRGRR